ncbi:hypothetical protein PsorP6_007047 [Peronosclerospora sorghi]|uniref:Uncharacterized protein n=1 Tax=Peronosclerospora sorghi TaxID=230839 RepID=A0ACC0WB63_9STRA|nr:hypothetical protein PsorP6_007047 [Peronosclerospora sorghi]
MLTRKQTRELTVLQVVASFPLATHPHPLIKNSGPVLILSNSGTVPIIASVHTHLSILMATRKPHRKSKARRVKDPPDVQLSKTLAYALRHGAEKLGLEMKPSGFVPLAQLLALPLFQSYTEEQVEHVVRTNTKKRFLLTTDASGRVKYIRANQGHTLQLVHDQDLLTPLEAPDAIRNCIHGTYREVWDRIWQVGLSKMQRNHIHFTESEVTTDEVVSGVRSNCNLLIYIDFPTALNDGIKFFKSSNNVVLSPGMGDTGVIDKNYFLRVVQRDGTVVYEREKGDKREEEKK